MAGIVGIVSPQLKSYQLEVMNALKLTSYSERVKISAVEINDQIAIGRSYFDFVGEQQFSFASEEISVWVDGQVFNKQELGLSSHDSLAEALFNSYKQNKLDQLLVKMDGVFGAVIYDKIKHEILIISDRFGLKPFYIGCSGNTLVIASELKCFYCFKDFNVSIRKDVISAFIDLGHFLGDTTWFNEVNIVKPASVCKFEIENNKLSHRYYWTWANINRGNLKLSFHDAAKHMADLLKEAVKSRVPSGDFRLGISLSGGLDSRAILASAYKDAPLVTYTFGTQKSDDVTIAARVAHRAGVKNTFFQIGNSDWLSSRYSGVWKTDGQMNLIHMHYSGVMKQIEKMVDVNLSGFLGDVVLGGSYLTKNRKKFLDTTVNEDIARHYYGEHFLLTQVDDSFHSINTVDAYLMNNRGRRLIGMGAEEPNKTMPQQLPFFANALIEFAYALPDEWRADSKIYDYALAMAFPEFFTDIPDASSGVPLSTQHSKWLSVRMFVKTYVDKLKLLTRLQVSFADYPNWIVKPETLSLIRSVINSKSAIIHDFIAIDIEKELIEPHLKRMKNNHYKILALLTMEIWFQQFFNQKLLPSETNLPTQ